VKIVAIIQARMGSTRLPGKVLKDLSGDTVLARVVSRVRRFQTLDNVVVATSTHAADDVVVRECRRLECGVFRGSEQDVLDRYCCAAREAQADIIVRITSDCPLIDPEVSDRTIRAFLDVQPDYASNVMMRTYPRGLDTEVMQFVALERAVQEATESYEREHVTPYLYEHPETFKLLSVTGEKDYSQYRWTLDTPEDLDCLRQIYSRFEGSDNFSWRDVLNILEREPRLAGINQHIAQKALREG